MLRIIWALGVFGLLATILGCGDAVRREAVQGSVTLDGQPLESGSILFTPLGEGPSAGGEIRAGRYELPIDGGPGPGEYRVSITAWRFVGPAIYDAATGGSSQEPVSIIPERYNTRSNLTVTVVEGEPNHFIFPLESS